MSNSQDASIGIGVESTYNTGVTPTRWFEFLPGESFKWNKTIKQGKGLRVSRYAVSTPRRVIPYADGSGAFSMEMTSKGMGLLLQACFGTGVSTNVSGATYQQLFTPGNNPSPLTVQVGLPRLNSDGTFTTDAYTHSGGIVDSFEFDFPNSDIAMWKTTLSQGNLTTATAYTAPTYATTPNLFQFANATIYQGTLTAPTSTATASAVTALADVRSGSISVNNNLFKRPNINGTGRQAKPTMGLKDISGKLEVEYDSVTFRDAILNDTEMTLLVTLTAGALSTGVETFQFALPAIKFDGDIPTDNGTDLVTQSLSFIAGENLVAAQAMWAVLRTADTAL